MESTGDMAILYAASDGPDFDLSFFTGVRGHERLRGKPNVQRSDER